MAQTSTLGNAAGILGGWIFAGCCVVGSLIYFEELKGVGRWALGVQAIEQSIEQANEQPTAAGRRQAAAAASADEPRRSSSSSGGSAVELRGDSRGHFFTDAQINGRSVSVMVDTGATIVALTAEDAERAGIYVRPSDFTARTNTANGIARVAPVMIEQISIGSITVRNVRGTVSEPGKLSETLLGMTFLSRLSRAELRRGTLLLEE